MPNRLARERSPYLLQHANNPVDWYPWGDEAFARARAEDKPIFLSIGYSTCHWCHVMEHESFEDQEVAAALNRDFVSIKVDREERPDVDRVYMMFVQATTGAGGWPMSVWLTPELKPFFGGTYFPPTSRWGRPGFIDLLHQLADAWRGDRTQVAGSADAVLQSLREASGADSGPQARAPVAGRGAIAAGIGAFAQAFDKRHGGFGGAPKFPRPAELLFLLNGYALTGDWSASQMALETLRFMALGGVRDHVGGGFHRYSVDAQWRVPHFEKMLYDQAQLVLAYVDAAQASGDAFYGSVAADTLAYVRRDLRAPGGAFFSAEDADSLLPGPVTGGAGLLDSSGRPLGHGAAEKREGAFYVWTQGELERLLGSDAVIVARRFGVEPGGNALADPQGEFTGQNILYISQSIEDIAARMGRPVDDVMAALAKGRQTLFEERSRRPRPHLDDKIITAWNGLMIAAFARAARVLVDMPERHEWQTTAIAAATWIREHLWNASDRVLLRRYRAAEPPPASAAGDVPARESDIEGFCEDYAYLVWGLVELFQATGDVQWLEWALDLTERQTALFFDADDGGWFSTTGRDASVLLRLKEDYDGAEPAAASVTVRNLIVLGHLTSNPDIVALAMRTLERYGPEIAKAVRVMPLMVANVALWHGSGAQVVIVGQADRDDTRALERVLAAHYVPAAVTIPIRSDAAADALAPEMPWLGAMTLREGRATAYVCHDFACQPPIVEPDELSSQLRAMRPSRLAL